MKYTFQFEKYSLARFNSILNRLDESEYTVVKEPELITHNEKGEKYYDPYYEAILDMDSECCLTFRMGMGNSIKIRRERTEEELAEEKRLHEKNTIRVNVQVPMADPSAGA